VELRRSEPEVAGWLTCRISVNKVAVSMDLGGGALFLSPSSHHGGGLEERLQDDAIVAVSMERYPGAVVLRCANHMVTKLVAMICG
jgi:hypothetical protein